MILEVFKDVLYRLYLLNIWFCFLQSARLTNKITLFLLHSTDALKQFSSNTPQLQESYSVTSSYADVRAGNSRYSVKNDSLLRLRPTNPTPSQSVAGKHVTNQQQSRPYNPTPGHALKDSFLLTDSDMTISPLHREESRPLHTSTALDSPLQKLIEEDPSQLDIIMNDSSGELYFKGKFSLFSVGRAAS